MTDQRGPANDAAYQNSDTTREHSMNTGTSGEPAGGPMPDDGKHTDVNGADLLPGAGSKVDATTVAGDAVGAASGSELADDGEGPDRDIENEVGNQQKPF